MWRFTNLFEGLNAPSVELTTKSKRIDTLLFHPVALFCVMILTHFAISSLTRPLCFVDPDGVGHSGDDGRERRRESYLDHRHRRRESCDRSQWRRRAHDGAGLVERRTAARRRLCDVVVLQSYFFKKNASVETGSRDTHLRLYDVRAKSALTADLAAAHDSAKGFVPVLTNDETSRGEGGNDWREC